MKRFGRIEFALCLISAVLFAGAVSANFAPVCPGFTPSAGSPFTVGNHPSVVALGDFNGDGKLDFAVANTEANYSGNDTVSILLNDGTGNFSPASGSPVAVGDWPISIAVGDFNGDGKLDLAVVNGGTNNVSILLGDGSGGFTNAPGSPAAAGNNPISVAVGDFNGDGKLDLAVANFFDNGLSILLGDGSGSFTAASGSPVSAGYSPNSVAVGDFDRDGKLDLAVANYNGNNVSILLGNGLGGFAAAPGSPVGVGTGPIFVGSADFDRDGKLDLAVANYWGDSVSILLGTGAGGFSPASGSPLALSAGDHPDGIAFGDLDGDGKLDLVVADFDGYNARILLGDGAGGFSAASISPLVFGSYVFFAAVGDFNGDGKADLAVSEWVGSRVSILLNTCDAITCANVAFQDAPGSPMDTGEDSGPRALAVGDFNRDGKPDVAMAKAGLNKVTMFLGNADGTFVAGSDSAVGSEPSSVAVGDFDRDGKLDLAVTNWNDVYVSVLLGNGDGTFQAKKDSDAGAEPISVAAGDFDRDGKLDLAVVNHLDDTVSIFLGNGDGTFAARVDYGTGSWPFGIAVGDFNGDGKLDLAVANELADTVSILLGHGNGTFQAKTDYATGSWPTGVAAADLDGDGRLDLAVANQNGDEHANADTASILLGNGDGTFQAKTDYATGSFSYSVAVGDFDRDGRPDLAVPSENDQTVSILLGDGDGTFQPRVTYGTGVGSISVAVADLDRDGRADLAIPNMLADTMSILLNVCGACAPTTTAVANATMEYDPVNLTATVSSTSTVGSGTVTFSIVETGDVIGSASVVGGTATLAVAAQTLSPTPGHYPDLAEGDYTIKAEYGGSAGFCASSKTGTLTVSWEVVTGLARALKQGVLSDLQAIRAAVTDRGDRGKLDDAIKHLTKSLDPRSWIDDSHVKKGHAGESVFNEEKPAADRLRDLIHRNRSGLTSGQLQPLIADLIAADRALADTAIDDAVAASGKPADIKRAKDELARGDASASAGRHDAIDHYKNAWKAVTH